MTGGQVLLKVIPGASHLFEETGALEEVARLARDWFATYLFPVSASEHHGDDYPPAPGGFGACIHPARSSGGHTDRT